MASTKLSRIVPWLLMLVVTFAVSLAWAGQPVIAVAPIDHETRNVRNGLAELLSAEIAASGYLRSVAVDEATTMDATHLSAIESVADYVLLGEVAAFSVSDRDQKIDLGDEFADMSRMMGTGSEVAHVALNLRLIEVATGAEVKRWQAEGVESRDGLRMDSLNAGWLGSIDFTAAEFSETMIGHATLKAIGNALWELYQWLPLRGMVLAVSGDAVVVNLDENNGLAVGDELTVVRVREIVSSSGEVAWRDAERLGSVQVLEFQPGRALCLVLDGAGLIVEGDEVRPVVASYTLPSESDVG